MPKAKQNQPQTRPKPFAKPKPKPKPTKKEKKAIKGAKANVVVRDLRSVGKGNDRKIPTGKHANEPHSSSSFDNGSLSPDSTQSSNDSSPTLNQNSRITSPTSTIPSKQKKKPHHLLPVKPTIPSGSGSGSRQQPPSASNHHPYKPSKRVVQLTATINKRAIRRAKNTIKVEEANRKDSGKGNPTQRWGSGTESSRQSSINITQDTPSPPATYIRTNPIDRSAMHQSLHQLGQPLQDLPESLPGIPTSYSAQHLP